MVGEWINKVWNIQTMGMTLVTPTVFYCTALLGSVYSEVCKEDKFQKMQIKHPYSFSSQQPGDWCLSLIVRMLFSPVITQSDTTDSHI